jgi:Glycosyltransferase 61
MVRLHATNGGSSGLAIAPTGTRLRHFADAAATMVGYKVRRGLGVSARQLADVAEKTWEIAPGVDEPHVPLYIPESHFGRIQALAPPYQREPVSSLLAAIRQERHRGGATRAYLLRDAFLLGQRIYCGLYQGDLYSTLGWRALWRANTAEIDEGVMASTYSGARWFAHLLYDEFPLQELASTLGNSVGHMRPAYPHEPGWRAVLGVPAPPAYAAVRARKLIWVDDCGQNLAKRDRYQALRSRVTGFANGHDRVFLRRNPFPVGEVRRIVNGAEVEERLVREGFHIIDTGQVTVDEMLTRCMNASLVVSVEGSHAAPAYYFSRRGACQLYLYPPRRVSVLMPRLASFYGQVGAMFIGEPSSEGESAFYVNPDELMREIDHAAAFAGRQSLL